MGEERKTLKRFFYKDISLFSSFYSQVFYGDLLEVKKSSSEGVDKTSNLGTDVKFVQGKKETSKFNQENLSRTIDPGDMKALELLESLDLKPKNYISNKVNSDLMLMNGPIKIRNFKAMKSMMGSIFDAFDNDVNMSTQDQNGVDLLGNMMNKIQMGIEFEMIFNNHGNAIGVLKEEFMDIDANDLMRIYGSKLPGEWFILGIVDKINSQKKNQNNNNDFRTATENYMNEIKDGLFNNKEIDFSIIPILIYKIVNYSI